VILLYPYTLLLIPLYWLCDRLCFYRASKLYLSNYDLVLKSASNSRDYKRFLEYIIVISLIFAIATPAKREYKLLNTQKGYSIALLLDASYSMLEGKRFTRAKEALKSFIKARNRDRLALEVFGDYAQVASFMTYQKEGLFTILDYLKPAIVGGRDTALNEAIFLGAKLFDKEEEQNRVMILLTDGLDTVKNVPLDIVLKELKSKKIRVYTIGVGDDYKKEVLKKIANETGGKFFAISDSNSLNSIYKSIDNLEKAKIKSIKVTSYSYYYQYPLLLATILLTLLLILNFKERSISIFLVLIFSLLALFNPPNEINKKEEKNSKLLVAIDVSKSMDLKDLYPNRFKFAIHKLDRLLRYLRGLNVGVLLFSDSVYLLSPPTSDYEALRTLLKQVDIKDIKRGKENWSSLIDAVSKFRDKNSTSLMVFSTGEGIRDINRLSKKLNGIKLYIYPTATIKGAPFIDENENLSVSYLVESKLSKLALKNGGKFFNLDKTDSDIKDIADTLSKKEAIDISDIYTDKLYIWLLLIALIILFYRRLK